MILKKKVLFIAPAFMNYEKTIIDALSTTFDVTYLDSEPILQKVRVRYKQMPLPLKGFLKTFHTIRERVRDSFLKQEMEKNKLIQDKLNICLDMQYDIVIAINGDGLPKEIFLKLRNNNKKALMILYLWDDYDLLFKINHIGYFDRVFSFNELDCRKYGFKKLFMFTPPNKTMQMKNFEKQYDICMIGSATPERVELVKKLKEKYGDFYNIFVFLYSKENKYDIETCSTPLNFDEYMEVISRSRCLFEIVRDRQKGPTTRVNDCKFVKTKIITTNSCKESYVGNGKNVLFLDEKNTIPEDFIKSSFDNDIEPGVTIEQWISSLLKG